MKFQICFCIQEAWFTEALLFVFSTYTLHYPTQVDHVTVSCLAWPRPALCTLLPSWPIVRKRLGESLHSRAPHILVISTVLTPPHPVRYSYGQEARRWGTGYDFLPLSKRKFNSTHTVNAESEWGEFWREKAVEDRDVRGKTDGKSKDTKIKSSCFKDKRTSFQTKARDRWRDKWRALTRPNEGRRLLLDSHNE